jgi:hypothetical protein
MQPPCCAFQGRPVLADALGLRAQQTRFTRSSSTRWRPETEKTGHEQICATTTGRCNAPLPPNRAVRQRQPASVTFALTLRYMHPSRGYAELDIGGDAEIEPVAVQSKSA